MEVKLYMPYYDYNDGAFDVSDNYYGKDEYIKKVSEEYNKNKDVVFNSMMAVKNGVSSPLVGLDGQTYKFGTSSVENEDRVAYSSCSAILYDATGKNETVDGLITHFARQESFVEMLEFDLDTSEEEFETELSLWKREHNNINKYKSYKGEEWAWFNEPKRNIKMCFKNNSNEDLYTMLEDCKIMDILEDGTLIVLVEKIKIIDRI